MKTASQRTVRGLVALILLSFPIGGCDNSGYGMAESYVISGTVSTGERVSGTVHVLTQKRADAYEGSIDPSDGSYEITVTQHDPPYLVWAELDQGRTLYSYCSGNRNPSDALIELAMAEGTDHQLAMYQTTNITPLNDLIVGLAYLEDPQARFEANPAAGFPEASKIRKFQEYIEDIFVDTFAYLAAEEDNPAYTDFDLFHGQWIAEGVIDQLLTVLEVQYTETSAPEFRTGKLVGVGSFQGDEVIFYEYDLNEDNVLGTPISEAEALSFFKGRLGI